MAIRDIALAVLVNLVWGLNFVAAVFAVEGLSPFLTNSFRFLIVTVCLLPFLRMVPGRMQSLLVAAFVLGVAHFGLMFVAMAKADGVSALAIVSQLATPIATIMAVIFLKEKVGWKRTLGISISFLGVMVLGFDPQVLQYIDAVLWMTAAAFCYGLSNIQMRKLKDVPAVTTQAWVGLMGMIGSFTLSMLFETGQMQAIMTVHWTVWAAVLYSGTMSSIVGHGGINYLLTKYEVSQVSPYFVLTPVFAILAGVLILDEVVTQRMLIGGAITLTGVAIVTLRNSTKGGRELKRGVRVGAKVARH